MLSILFKAGTRYPILRIVGAASILRFMRGTCFFAEYADLLYMIKLE